MTNRIHDTCSICLEDVDLRTKSTVMLMSCLHSFHRDCLRKYLYTPRHIELGIHTCPNCRNPMSAKQVRDVVPDYVHNRMQHYAIKPPCIVFNHSGHSGIPALQLPSAPLTQHIDDLERLIQVAQKELVKLKNLRTAFEIVAQAPGMQEHGGDVAFR